MPCMAVSFSWRAVLTGGVRPGYGVVYIGRAVAPTGSTCSIRKDMISNYAGSFNLFRGELDALATFAVERHWHSFII